MKRVCLFRLLPAFYLLAWLCSAALAAVDGAPLPGTPKLTIEGDISSQLVDGVDRFLLREIEKSVARRTRCWDRDRSSPQRYTASLEPNRQRLQYILGARDTRVPFDGLELVGTTAEPALVGQAEGYQVFAVQWPAFGDVSGEGLLLVPSKPPVADVVAIPDADQTPEMIAGLTPGVPAPLQFARRLAECGCRVLVPVLVSREVHKHRIAQLTNREFIYRAAFELGRHVIGYEVQKVLAGVDWFVKQRGQAAHKIGVIGWGEGGLLALAAGAIDPRIDAVCVSGYFDSRQNVWQEPADRNVFGLLEQFGDAELASMIAPRTLVVEAAGGVEFVIPPGTGGAPGRLVTPSPAAVEQEFARARALVGDERLAAGLKLVASGDGSGPPCSESALQALLAALAPKAKLVAMKPAAEHLRKSFDPKPRQERQVYELNRHSQRLLLESPEVRKQFFAKLDTSSLEKFQKTVEWYRNYFYDEVVGRFDCERLPLNAGSRKVYDEPKFTGYEVVLDVFPNVIAYGLLLVPKDIKPGQRRPVVVCQHGLEGRPEDTVDTKGQGFKYYQAFAATLAGDGFVTFAPQNLYLFKDRFRTLQRKANPLKKTLFSIIVPQHQQIVDWLSGLPFVDKTRVAFYGLSYGGKTAMRVPPLVTNYCLSICSGDFNEWVAKNASTRLPMSYMGTGEYEIFEFDLGSTFNYAEMATLMAPRPFMVERGHYDGVGSDEMVAYEFAKVRFLYEAKLGIGDRCELEWFTGPHMIHGKGTFEFLHKQLNWPRQ